MAVEKMSYGVKNVYGARSSGECIGSGVERGNIKTIVYKKGSEVLVNPIRIPKGAKALREIKAGDGAITMKSGTTSVYTTAGGFTNTKDVYVDSITFSGTGTATVEYSTEDGSEEVGKL